MARGRASIAIASRAELLPETFATLVLR